MPRRSADTTLLRRSASDPAAFERFFRMHAESLLAFLTRRTLDPHLSLELAAETFAKAFEQRKRFRGSTEAEAAAWLYRIARNEHLQYLRRGKVARKAIARLGIVVPALSADDLERVETLASLEQLRERVRTSFSLLPAEQRDAIQLRVIENLPYTDVAARLGVPEATVRARVSRGLRRLREQTIAPMTIEELSWMTD